tara:strand:+ start:140839 stop:141999 length:1161 start_codon:yes stop_codon:yes gene_type:complete
MALMKVRESNRNIPKDAKELCDRMLRDLEKGKKPLLEAIKCSLDNSFYNPKVGYLTPGKKTVKTELNVSSVQKLARTVFMLEILLNNIKTGAVNTKRELYYMAKGLVKSDRGFKALDFEEQTESDAVVEFICDMMQVYREEMNCFANDRGGQTYSQCLSVTETLLDGSKTSVDLANLGTAPFQPKNRPQSLKLKATKKIKFCLVVESEGTANTLVANGMTRRNNCIVMGAGGVPSNAVRAWCKTISDQLSVPIFFFGDLDAYTLQNIYRTLKAGSAASLIRNSDFSAPEVRFLGILPEDVRKYDLHCYSVNDKNASEARSLKKAKDALENDPFFRDKKNKDVSAILKWLIKEKIRCEQQALFSVDPKDPHKTEKIILDKIKTGSYV